MPEYDHIGGYSYEPGYCGRDAFRQYFGDAPILDEFPYDCSFAHLRAVCARYGWQCQINQGDFQRTFRVGQAVVWVLDCDPTRHDGGHYVFSRDPQRVVDGQRRGEYTIIGYILLED